MEPDVNERDAPEEPPKGKPVEGKGKTEETETISKAELAALRRERDEARESERFWADRARGKPPEAQRTAETKDDEEDDQDLPEDENIDALVTDFSTKGVKALVSRGLITKKMAKEIAAQVAGKVARQMITAEREKATTDHTIMSEFPELNDPESELFQATRTELQRLVKIDPAAGKSPAALYSAASIAKAKLDAKAPKRGRYSDEGEYDGEDRRRRADAQGASRGRGSRDLVDPDDGLSPQMRQILAGMHPDKTEEERLATFRLGQKLIRNGGNGVKIR